VSRLSVGKWLEGDATGQLTQVEERGYSMPYNIMPSNKNSGGVGGWRVLGR